MQIEERPKALKDQKHWAEYYCWNCQNFALQGGRAVWCDFFASWMHLNCHERTLDGEHQKYKGECYEQQVLPAAD